MFIETLQSVAYGVPIKVFLQLPGLEHEAVIPSTVRWNQPDGMGVQFGPMGVRETHALLQILEHN
jgi:type IV pilus assembly protein PilZ